MWWYIPEHEHHCHALTKMTACYLRVFSEVKIIALNLRICQACSSVNPEGSSLFTLYMVKVNVYCIWDVSFK